MPQTLTAFFAAAAPKAAADLEAAYLKLPEEKRNWNPAPKARSAADQVAECALLNINTADLLHARIFDPNFDMAAYQAKHAELAALPEAALVQSLRESAQTVCAAILAVPEADLDIEISMPWGPMTLTQIIAYPYWNMGYHEGQVNYIGSLLEA